MVHRPFTRGHARTEPFEQAAIERYLTRARATLGEISQALEDAFAEAELFAVAGEEQDLGAPAHLGSASNGRPIIWPVK